MKKLFTLLMILAVCSTAPVVHAAGKTSPDAGDIARIKENLYFITLQNTPKSKYKEVKKYIERFDLEKGQFRDLDYTDNSAAVWQPGMHWRRMVDMARVYQLPGTDLYHNARLRDCIKRGIEYWMTSKHMAKNAWWNLIGVPYDMGKVFILMEKDIPAELITGSMGKMLFGVRDVYYYHGPATGQNLLWLTFIHVYASALTGDHAGLERAYKRSADEIVVTMHEGIQPDNSFHQHRAQSYAFGYGKGFSMTAAQIIFSAMDTYYAIPQDKVDILGSFILDGQQWCSRNQMLEYTAKGREISRPHPGTSSIIIALELMMKADPGRAAEYGDFYSQLTGGRRTVTLTGNKVFPYIDFMVHQRPGFFFSIKGASDRIFSTEEGNGENLKGYYLGRGTQFIATRGDEYEGIFPMWNWERLPGALCTQSGKALPTYNWWHGTRGTTPFVKGASDGVDGCFAYDYNADGIKARRGWFCIGDVVVGLVSGLSFDTEYDVYQTINQCFGRGDVYVDGKKIEGSPVAKEAKNASAVWHDSVGYIILSGGDVVLKKEEQSGSWYGIYNSVSKKQLSADVFTLALNEGKKQKGASLAYAVLAGVSPAQVDKSQLDHIKVLRNDAKAQVVWDRRGEKVFVAAYEPTEVKMPYGGRKIYYSVPTVVVYNKNALEGKKDPKFAK